jgi:hypothetical protein
MNTVNLAIAGLIGLGAIATENPIALADLSDRIVTPKLEMFAQTALSESSEGELKAWCSQAGGTWLGKSCQWQDVLAEDRELSLDRQCSDRGGIWQTLYEEVIGPSFCGNGFCTGDAVVIDYLEQGVGCVWEDDSSG